MANQQPPREDDPDRIDAVHHALADDYRRAVIRYLRVHDRATTTELVEHVRVAEGVEDGEAVAVHLSHVALPVLAATGVVEYDRQEETVTYVGDALVDHHLGPKTTVSVED